MPRTLAELHTASLHAAGLLGGLEVLTYEGTKDAEEAVLPLIVAIRRAVEGINHDLSLLADAESASERRTGGEA